MNCYLLGPSPETRPGSKSSEGPRHATHTHTAPGQLGAEGGATEGRKLEADGHRPLRPGHGEQQSDTSAPLTQADRVHLICLTWATGRSGEIGLGKAGGGGDGRTGQSFHSCSPCTSHRPRNR